MKPIALLLALASLPTLAAENTLTTEEKKEGYRLMIDGKTFNRWKNPSKKNVPNNAWSIENGTLKTVVEGKKFSEDLISEKQYSDFDLKFDCKLSPAANT